MPGRGNATLSAYDSIALRSSPSSNGSNVLKRGIIQVGAMYCMAREKRVTASQAYAHAQVPPYSKKVMIPASSGAPIMTDSSSPFSMSRSEEHTSELQSRGHLVCRLLLEK